MFPGCAVNSIHFRKHIPSPFFFTFFITRMGTFFKEGKAFAGHSILIKIYTKPDSPTSNMWWCKQKIWRGCCCFHKSTATKKFADSQLPTKYYLVPLFHRLFRKLFSSNFLSTKVLSCLCCCMISKHELLSGRYVPNEKSEFSFFPCVQHSCVLTCVCTY